VFLGVGPECDDEICVVMPCCVTGGTNIRD